MPRKPKLEKHTTTVIVDGKPIGIILHPPAGSRKSWYAYWNGLVASRSTGQRKLEDAIVAAESMIRNGGKPVLKDQLLSDEEFRKIQVVHFGRKTDEKAKRRAEKSLYSCLDAIAAFAEITDLIPVTLATPGDCAQFQRVALILPNGWRKLPCDSRRPVEDYSLAARALRKKAGKRDPLDDGPCYSANNVLKWSRSLQAAFERANRNALKRKCVRGVVPEEKLLSSNPWSQFTWIEGHQKPPRSTATS